MEAASPSKTLSGAGPARLHCGWDVSRRPHPAPPAVARPARATALPRPGTRGDATPCADRPDRRPLALRAHAGAHGRHGTLPRAARPAAGLAAHADERRSAHLDAGLPDVGHVRRAAGHPRLPLPRQAPPRRRVLPARAGRPAGRGGAGAGPPRHPRRRQRLRLRLHGRRHEQPPDVRDDAAAERLWRVLRRVPEHRYDLYVLSDHGQAQCTPYVRLSGGKPIEQTLFDDFLDPLAVHAEPVPAGRARRVVHGLAAYRTHRAPGFFQRFVNYLERDFPRVLGGTRGVREHGGIRVVSAGPNAFVYFLEVEGPVRIEWIEERFPGLTEELSRSRGIGFVLARAGDGPVCAWRGKRYRLHELGAGPFAGRDDLPRVLEGLRDLMAMESAGDLVVYGIDAPEGDVSFVDEVGAHAGTSYDELHTFVIHPPTVTLPSAIAHPVELYAHFRHAREAA